MVGIFEEITGRMRDTLQLGVPADTYWERLLVLHDGQ